MHRSQKERPSESGKRAGPSPGRGADQPIEPGSTAAARPDWRGPDSDHSTLAGALATVTCPPTAAGGLRKPLSSGSKPPRRQPNSRLRPTSSSSSSDPPQAAAHQQQHPPPAALLLPGPAAATRPRPAASSSCRASVFPDAPTRTACSLPSPEATRRYHAEIRLGREPSAQSSGRGSRGIRMTRWPEPTVTSGQTVCL